MYGKKRNYKYFSKGCGAMARWFSGDDLLKITNPHHYAAPIILIFWSKTTKHDWLVYNTYKLYTVVPLWIVD